MLTYGHSLYQAFLKSNVYYCMVFSRGPTQLPEQLWWWYCLFFGEKKIILVLDIFRYTLTELLINPV